MGTINRNIIFVADAFVATPDDTHHHNIYDSPATAGWTHPSCGMARSTVGDSVGIPADVVYVFSIFNYSSVFARSLAEKKKEKKQETKRRDPLVLQCGWLTPMSLDSSNVECKNITSLTLVM